MRAPGGAWWNWASRGESFRSRLGQERTRVPEAEVLLGFLSAHGLQTGLKNVSMTMAYSPAELIDSVRMKFLRVLPDERGQLMELYSGNDELFIGFAHSYLTTVYPGVVKAWHLHGDQIDTMAVVSGSLKLVLYDRRDGSKSHGRVNEFFLGEHNPLMVQIPAGIFHGFMGLGTRETLVINFPSAPYRREAPDEYRLAPDHPSIPYDWWR